jgi:hypothetical protein
MITGVLRNGDGENSHEATLLSRSVFESQSGIKAHLDLVVVGLARIRRDANQKLIGGLPSDRGLGHRLDWRHELSVRVVDPLDTIMVACVRPGRLEATGSLALSGARVVQIEAEVLIQGPSGVVRRDGSGVKALQGKDERLDRGVRRDRRRSHGRPPVRTLRRRVYKVAVVQTDEGFAGDAYHEQAHRDDGSNGPLREVQRALPIALSTLSSPCFSVFRVKEPCALKTPD